MQSNAMEYVPSNSSWLGCFRMTDSFCMIYLHAQHQNSLMNESMPFNSIPLNFIPFNPTPFNNSIAFHSIPINCSNTIQEKHASQYKIPYKGRLRVESKPPEEVYSYPPYPCIVLRVPIIFLFWRWRWRRKDPNLNLDLNHYNHLYFHERWKIRPCPDLNLDLDLDLVLEYGTPLQIGARWRV